MAKILTDYQLKKLQETFSITDKIYLYAEGLADLEDQIHVSENEYAQKYLCTNEHDKYLSFKFQKRKTEWLGGRIAAKKALRALLAELGYLLRPQELEISSTIEGRPLFIKPVEITETIDISISHSAKYAAALTVKDAVCGLDLQKITQTLHKVQSRFATDAERKILQQHFCFQPYEKSWDLALLWTAKEAFRKSVPTKPLLGFLEVTLESIVGDPETGLVASFSCSRKEVGESLKAYVTLSGDFAIAISILPA